MGRGSGSAAASSEDASCIAGGDMERRTLRLEGSNLVERRNTSVAAGADRTAFGCMRFARNHSSRDTPHARLLDPFHDLLDDVDSVRNGCLIEAAAPRRASSVVSSQSDGSMALHQLLTPLMQICRLSGHLQLPQSFDEARTRCFRQAEESRAPREHPTPFHSTHI